MEPFISIGGLLKKEGHEPICVLPEQFRLLAEESGLSFRSLGSEYLDLLESKEGKRALGGARNPFQRIVAYIKLGLKSLPINKKIFVLQSQIIEELDPDLILHNGKSTYPVIWGLGKKNRTALVSPVPFMHYVEGHAHIAFSGNYGRFLNRLTFWLAYIGLKMTIVKSLPWINLEGKIKGKEIGKALQTNRAFYTISSHLFPKPDSWTKNIQVFGYQEREYQKSYSPPGELSEFLSRHEKILFVTFGSMTNPDPQGKTQAIIQVLSDRNIPAIMNTSVGGLEKPSEFDHERFFFIEGIPYNYIFPRMYAVVHHGGAGTTHLAIKHGCASMIIPHILDQFVWNKIINEKGVGPKGMKITALSADSLKPKIDDLWNNKAYKLNAEQLGVQIKNENHQRELLNFVLNP